MLGFALENFDVMGGWREKYRSEADGEPAQGIAKSGQKVTHRWAQPVDASGELPDGRKFNDIRDFKALLLADERQVARNLARQLAVYATGAPVGFAGPASSSPSSSASRLTSRKVSLPPGAQRLSRPSFLRKTALA